MNVSEIMSSPLETVSSEATITNAAEKMKSFDIGVLPVMKEDEVVGIITDRDIVIRVIAENLDPQKTQVKKAMSTDIWSCSEEMELEEAAELMEEKQVHRLLVLGEDGAVTGILSIGDIARKTEREQDHLVHEVLEKVCVPARF
ncbi:MAG: Hypoxic response protein 1 [Planctomycetes bacterium ADurb.Bin401]|nr:MAG: Hypoxic response protein 1 [Planctomycetes bacterium ADurb.Bin401]